MSADTVAYETRAEDADRHGAPRNPLARWSKRALDILTASIALVLLAPLMIATAIVIRITMGSPVIDAQPRLGANGRIFRCFKFRTMANNAGDARSMGVGQLLRRWGIDELPQLINVARGDMSCVGPRPAVAVKPTPCGEKAPDDPRVQA